MWLLIPLILPGLLAAQAPKAPPTFEPGDKEGLVISPNSRIRLAWKRKVFWRTSSGSSGGAPGKIPPHTPGERQQMTQTLDSLTALLKATPTGTSGEGFWVNDARTLGYVDPVALPPGVPLDRFPLQFETGVFPFYHEDRLDNGAWKLSLKGETESVYYFFNRLPAALRQNILFSESQAAGRSPVEFYLRPRVTGRIGGLPVYEGSTLVVSRAGRDPWAPVPLMRALKGALPLYEQDRKTAENRLASLKKKNAEVQDPAWEQQMRDRFEKTNGALRTTRPSNYEARLRSLEHEIRYTREKAAADASPAKDATGAWYWNPVEAFEDATRRLAALSDAEGSRPACFLEASAGRQKDGRYAMTGSILPAGANAECRELARTNWEYYDFRLPRAAPQILVVFDFGRCAKLDGGRIVAAPVTRFDAPPQGCVQHARMWQELDWTKLAELLAP